MGILRNFYSSDLYPGGLAAPKTQEYIDACNKAVAIIRKVEELLDEEANELWADLYATKAEIAEMENAQAFQYGFSFATQMFLDAAGRSSDA